MLRVLRNPAYARLFSAQVLALLGTGLLTVALGLLAFDIAGANAGLVLGTALTIKMVAYVGVVPLTAAIFDRLEKKAVMVSADLARLTIALLLPFVSEAWQIYVLVFVLQSASATFTPAFQSLIPSVLPEPADYTRALSLSRLAYDLEALISPTLAAALLAFVTYSNLFLGTAIGFACSAALVLSANLAVPVADSPTLTFWRRLPLGARIGLARCAHDVGVARCGHVPNKHSVCPTARRRVDTTKSQLGLHRPIRTFSRMLSRHLPHRRMVGSLKPHRCRSRAACDRGRRGYRRNRIHACANSEATTSRRLSPELLRGIDW